MKVSSIATAKAKPSAMDHLLTLALANANITAGPKTKGAKKASSDTE